MFTLFLIGLAIAGVVRLANDYAAAQRVKREGHEAFQRCVQGGVALNWEIARDNDWFYDGNPIIGPAQHWYGDGSLRYDTKTHKTYPKGKYFYNSLGYKCKSSFHPPKETKAPG